ncbi:MAG: PEP-CTERM sorting domain-containing protein [Bryobacteraceae bacterium]
MGLGRGDRVAVPRVTYTPEPSTVPFLAGGVILMGFVLRRKLIRAS